VKNSSLQLDLSFIDHIFVIMNSPARMGAAGIKTCGNLFVCLGFEDPSNHWTKRMVNTRLTTQDPRTCPGPEDRNIT